WITVVFLILSIGGILWTSSVTPTGFVPNEDRGMIMVNVELPAGASLDRTVKITQNLFAQIKAIPGVQGGSMVNGYSLIGGAGSNYALGFIKLESWEDRDDESMTSDAIVGQMFGIGAGIPGANILF